MGESILILTCVVLFASYKIFAEEVSYEFLAVGIVAFASMLSVVRLIKIAETTIKKGHYHVSFLESILVGDVVVIGLGSLAL